MFNSVLVSLGLAKNWPTITKEDIAKHNSEQSLYIVAGEAVYDVTELLDDHPGGNGALLRRAGGCTDCTRDLNFHSTKARKEWATFQVAVIGKRTTFFPLPKRKAEPVAVPIEEAAAARGKCACPCHSEKLGSLSSSGTQTICCREGTGLPCTQEHPETAVLGPACVWNSAGKDKLSRSPQPEKEERPAL